MSFLTMHTRIHYNNISVEINSLLLIFDKRTFTSAPKAQLIENGENKEICKIYLET